jgi:hypothetical protein
MTLQINVGFYGDQYMFWGFVYPVKWNQASPYWTEWVWGWFLQLEPMKVTVLHHTVCSSVYEPWTTVVSHGCKCRISVSFCGGVWYAYHPIDFLGNFSVVALILSNFSKVGTCCIFSYCLNWKLLLKTFSLICKLYHLYGYNTVRNFCLNLWCYFL